MGEKTVNLSLRDFDGCQMSRYEQRTYVVTFADRASLLEAIFTDPRFRELHIEFCGYSDKDQPLIEIWARFEMFKR